MNTQMESWLHRPTSFQLASQLKAAAIPKTQLVNAMQRCAPLLQGYLPPSGEETVPGSPPQCNLHVL